MAATAEARLAKRKINELEQKLKKLQRELRELKTEHKKVGTLRKQANRAIQVESDCKDLLEEVEAENSHLQQQESKKQNNYRCRNQDCEDNTDCVMIEAGARKIILCKSCGSRYCLEKKDTR